MYFAAENANMVSMQAQAGTQWNLFLMTGDVPTSVNEVHTEIGLSDMKGIYANAIAGLRLLSVNSTTYGTELVAFENVAQLFTLKMHGARSTNGLAGIQLLPQSIDSNIQGLEKPAGFVNGLESMALAPATATTHITTDGWIEYDFGDAVSVNRVVYGNFVTTTRNPSTMAIEYLNGSAWVVAATGIAVKTYNAAGIESTFAPISARRWRVRFLDNTGTVAANTLVYNYIRFFASAVPSNVMSKENIPVTWGILVPAAPVASIYESLFAQRVPAFIFTLGGPADGGVGLLNRSSGTIEDIFSVISLKLKTAVVTEVA
jgi:hypothetical protein